MIFNAGRRDELCHKNNSGYNNKDDNNNNNNNNNSNNNHHHRHNLYNNNEIKVLCIVQGIIEGLGKMNGFLLNCVLFCFCVLLV